ncbi:MAG: type II secretion system protein [Verrucomicrobiota bacterium]
MVRHHKFGEQGFTLIELLTSIAILGLLIGILAASMGSSRERAAVAGSLSNLRQMGAAAGLYSNDHGGKLPPHAVFDEELGENREWCYARFGPQTDNPFSGGLLAPYLENAKDVLTCPVWQPSPEMQELVEQAFNVPGNLGYGYNGLYLGERKIEEDGSFIGNYNAYPRSAVINPSKTVMFTISATNRFGQAASQEMIWPPGHLTAGGSSICVRLVNSKETLVGWVDGSVSVVSAIPVEEFPDDGIFTGHIDMDEDGEPDVDIWYPFPPESSL